MSEESQELPGYRLRYVGERFNDAKLPLEVLADLPAFRELLISTMRDTWKELNPDRQRVPRGFEKAMTFVLSKVEEGSAVPVIEWERSSAQLEFPELVDQLDSVVDMSYLKIAQIFGSDRVVKLTKPQLKALNKFGSSLQYGEKIEFLPKGKDAQSPRENVLFLDVQRRKNLITRDQQTFIINFSGTGELVGVQVQLESGPSYIKVQIDSGDTLVIPVDTERVVNEFDGSLGSIIEFDLVVEMDSSDKIISVTEVSDIGLVEEFATPYVARLVDEVREFEALEKNWIDGDSGEVIDKMPRLNAERFLRSRPFVASKSVVFPTEDGGVSLEFSSDGWSYTIEFLGTEILMYGIKDSDFSPLNTKSFNNLSTDFLKYFDSIIKDPDEQN